VQFALSDAKLLAPKFDLVKAGAHGFELRFTSKMNGELTRRQQTFDLKEKAQQDGGGAYALALQSDDFAWVDLGEVRLEVCFQPLPTPVLVPFSQTLDLATLNTFLVLFFLGALFVISAANRQLEGDEYADELNSNQARIAKLILKAPEIQKNPFLEELAHQKQQAEMAAKHSGDEGQMGRKDTKKKNGRTTPKGNPTDKDIARNMTQKIFGGKGGISSIIGNGHGGALEAALGNLNGPTAGDAQGLGGLGIKGQSSGGGGIGKTLGIGAVGTKGRGGGNGAYGMGAGNIGGKTSIDPSITSSEPEVMGSLDKELIRRVIHANRNQIRYCYESQLQQHPKLSGRVSVKFVITPSGSVATSDVVQDTTSNRELETCVAGRVHTWIFPKPKGGGVVMVTYPFIFKQAGQ
jgi:hypothetical protein